MSLRDEVYKKAFSIGYADEGLANELADTLIPMILDAAKANVENKTFEPYTSDHNRGLDAEKARTEMRNIAIDSIEELKK